MTETIPFELHRIESNNYHSLIQGKINGQPVVLILDTGASSTVIDQSVAIGTPIEPDEDHEVFAAGVNAKRIDVKQVELPNMQLGDVVFNNIIVFSTDLRSLSELYLEMTGIEIHGLLGCDFMVDNNATVDFSTGTIQLNRIHE
ncbi:MAG TPA: retropepsin-like aspartic protease [Tenuifilaceae bacterium]|jgi:predicted aspartyl protease|nr:retropepsin-like aspartic protease [Tenuifilaceae bacterium]